MKSSNFLNAGADLVASLRVVFVTILLCGGLYPLLVFGIAHFAAPEAASGSLIRESGSGTVVGSRLIGQSFTKPGYFWPRPSAVNYDAAAAGGSNLSPAGIEVRQRALKSVALFGADAMRKMPADLAAASGSGLDPDISLKAAIFQVTRVAHARNLDPLELEALVRKQASSGTLHWQGEGVVNVLLLNRQLDSLWRYASMRHQSSPGSF
jgi:K+-transporting ATPase ATPase C chain